MARTSRFRTAGDVGLLGLRAVLGGYLMGHGAQKAFGALDGPGLDAAGELFEEKFGLAPGRPMATVAAGSELAGGALTVAGLGGPVGPLAIVAAMATAAATAHRGN